MRHKTESLLDNNKVMDARALPCSVKHGLILKTWHELAAGDYFVLLNDHDPVPLRRQLSAEFPDAVSWEYLEQGPDFRVKIAKLKPTPKDHVYHAPGTYGCSADH